jgi:hypothetical protein
MALRHKSHFWRGCQVVFRRCRMTAWCLLLAILGAALYLDQAELPRFLKDPLLQKLHSRGLDLKFSRLRWRLIRGLVAEEVLFAGAPESAGPTLALKEMEVQLDYAALARLQLQVHSLLLRDGRLRLPLADTNAPGRELMFTGIETELQLLPDDVWKLDRFRARFAGGDIQLAGCITNASAIRDWTWLWPSPQAPPGRFLRRLLQWADALEQVQFASPPRLTLAVSGDARDLHSFRIAGELKTPNAEAPWGGIREGLATVDLSPATPREGCRANITLRTGAARTPWASVTNLALSLQLEPSVPEPWILQSRLELAAAGLDSKWGAAAGARIAGQWIHSLTNGLPVAGEGQLGIDRPQAGGAGAGTARLNIRFSPAGSPAAERAWDRWTNIAPYAISWDGRADNLQSPELEAEEIVCEGEWRAPELRATRISGRLYGGSLQAAADLDVATRRFTFTNSSDFDIHGISAFLTEKSRGWLGHYSWEKSPVLHAEGALVFPDWTNRHPDWRLDIKPTVRVAGDFRLDNGALRGVQASSANGHFYYSNETWRLPDLVIARPEGELEMAHISDERTRDYYFHIRSTIDICALRPLLEPGQQRALDLLDLSGPPAIEGELWGQWYARELIGFKARVAATNFAFRGESVDGFQCALDYTNGLLNLVEPRLQRAGGRQQLAATGVGVSFSDGKVHITNGFSTAEPMVVARAIGPRVGRAVEPYRFLDPPTVRVNGVAPIHNEREADLHFDVDGGPFEWWKIKSSRVVGRLDWLNQTLRLRGVRAEFYGGSGRGNAAFDFQRERGADISFEAAVTDADLHRLMVDLASKTNRLEGLLTAQLKVTRGNTQQPRSWDGNGYINLRDGLIWEFPIFGVLSPALDALLPGLGSSRATRATATFALTNGVIHSDDLEIRASMMRLRYWGTVDLKQQVDAQAEAELLRDAWIVGRVLSLALWPVSKLFQFHITGDLRTPQSEPIYLVPKIVLYPFHPFRASKDLPPDFPPSPQTNAPATGPP